MANPTLGFASIDLSSAKIYTTSSNLKNAFIRVGVDYTAGSNQATVNENKPGYLGSGSIEPGMMLRSSGEFSSPTRITAYNPGTKVITLESTSAATNANQFTFITPPAGWIYVATASFSKIGGNANNPPADFRAVTGSEDTEYQSGDLKWGIIGQLEATASAGTGLTGKYAQYTITRVTNRDDSSTISFYATASDTVNSFVEPTGYSLTYNQSYLLLSEISGSYMTVVGANDLAGGGQGLGLAAYQNVVASTIASLESGGGSTFPFTGSAQITGSLSVTGSSTFELNQGQTTDFFLIKSSSFNPLKVNSNGVVTFGGFNDLPTAVEGGMAYSASNFYIGIE